MGVLVPRAWWVQTPRLLGLGVGFIVPLPKEQLIHDYFMVVAAGIARFVETSSEYAGVKPDPKNFEPSTWVMAQIGWAHRSSDLLAAQQRIQKESRNIASFFGEYDIFLTSTLAKPPARIGELLPTPKELRLLSVLRALPFKKLIDAKNTIPSNT